MTLDDVVPHPQYRMCHSRIVDAPPTAVWDELCGVTMSALPLGYALEGIRLLPARLAGRKHRALAGRTFLDVTPIPVLFSERPPVVLSAGLSQAWRPLGGQTPPRLDAAALRAWSQPGWIKVAMEFRFEPVPAGTLLSTETRILATDPGTRRSFAAYWFLIRPSSSAIRREVLAVVARRASRGNVAHAQTSKRKGLTMKACGVSGAAGDVVLLELAEPPSPGPGQVLLGIEAAGVGAWDRLLNDAGWDVGLRPPAALGVEGAGRVLAVGADVDEFAVGDRVLAHEAPLPGGSGFWAERVLITAAHAAACPYGLDPVLAGALPVNGLTALQALEMLGLGRGQRLLVTNGGGATGSLAIQLAAAMGVEVTTTASASAADRLRGLGATEVIDYHDPNWPSQARGGFDGALIAATGTAEAALPLVRDGGRLCSLTSDAPAAERGIASTDLYVRPDAAQLAQLVKQVSEGTLQLTPEVHPLREGPAAFTRVATGRAGGRKLLLIP